MEEQLLPPSTGESVPRRWRTATWLAGLLGFAGLVALLVSRVAWSPGAPASAAVFERAPEFLGLWEPTGRCPFDQQHEIVFAVAQKNQDELERQLYEFIDSASPNYRQWRTWEEVQEMTRNDEGSAALKQVLQELGDGVSIVREAGGSEFLTARAPVSIWEELLSAEFHIFRHSSTGDLRARASSFTIPERLHGHVTGILGVLDLEHPREPQEPADLREIKEMGLPFSVVERLLTPEKLRQAYKMPTIDKVPNSAWKSESSQAVFASLGQSWSPSDLEMFQKAFELPIGEVEQLDTKETAQGVAALREMAMHTSDSKCKLHPNSCTEANLDVQYMMAMSPWSKMGVYNMDSAGHPNIFTDFVQVLADMRSPPRVISISYGMPELAKSSSTIEAFNSVAKKLALQGVTLIVSSGDDGANGVAPFLRGKYKDLSCEQILREVGLAVDWPASSPWVTGVGATMGVESLMPEIACSVEGSGPTWDASLVKPSITSGGGFSSRIPRPSWQPEVPGQTTRGVPDVSLAGHVYSLVVGGEWTAVDGTSASAPAFGGMVSVLNGVLNRKADEAASKEAALACTRDTGATCTVFSCSSGTCTKFGTFSQKCICPLGYCADTETGSCQLARSEGRKRSVGFLNPVLYKYPDAFTDITQGSNNCSRKGKPCCGGYEAGKGWDPVTGLGSVNAEAVAKIMGVN